MSTAFLIRLGKRVDGIESIFYGLILIKAVAVKSALVQKVDYVRDDVAKRSKLTGIVIFLAQETGLRKTPAISK